MKISCLKKSWFLLIVLMLCTGICFASNILANGDFEGEDTGEITAIWKYIFKSSIFTEPDGNRCAKLEVIDLEVKDGKKRLNGALLIGGAKGYYGDIGTDALRVKPNTTYEFSFDAKGTIKYLNRVQFHLWPVTGGKGKIIETSLLKQKFPLTQEWVRYEGEVTTSDDTHTFALRLNIYTEEPIDNPIHKPGDYMLIDNVVIREKK